MKWDSSTCEEKLLVDGSYPSSMSASQSGNDDWNMLVTSLGKSVAVYRLSSQALDNFEPKSWPRIRMSVLAAATVVDLARLKHCSRYHCKRYIDSLYMDGHLLQVYVYVYVKVDIENAIGSVKCDVAKQHRQASTQK